MKKTAAALLVLLVCLPAPAGSAGITVLTVEDLALHFLTARDRAVAFFARHAVVITGTVTGLGPMTRPGEDRGVAPTVALGRFRGILAGDEALAALSGVEPCDTAWLWCRGVREANPLYAGECQVALVTRAGSPILSDDALLRALEGDSPPAPPAREAASAPSLP